MKVNQLKAGAVLSYVTMGIGTLVSLIYTPIMIEQLGESEWGVYKLMLSLVPYLDVLTFGLGSAYIRYYSIYKTAGDEDGMARLNGMFILLYSVLGALAFGVGWGLSCFLPQMFPALSEEELRLSATLLRIMALNSAVYFPVSVFNSNTLVNEKYLFNKCLGIIKTVLNPLFTIPLLLMGFKSVAVTVMALVVTVLSGILDLIYCFGTLKMHVSFKRFDVALLKEMFRFTFFVFIGLVVDKINWSIDSLLLGRYAGAVVVGVYGVASQLNIYYTSMATAFSSVFTPRAHRLVAAKRSDSELSDLFIRVGRIQFILLSMILVGFVCFGQAFVVLWSGEANAEAYWIAMLLFIPGTIPAIQNLGIEIQQAKNMHRFRSIAYMVIAVANILFSIPLIKLFDSFGMGAIGAAIGTGLTVIFGNGVAMNWYYKKGIGLDIGRFWREIARLLPPLVLPLVLGLLLSRFVLHTSWGSLAFCIVLFVISFVVCMWFFGMNAYEKGLITSAVNRVTGRFKKRR